MYNSAELSARDAAIAHFLEPRRYAHHHLYVVHFSVEEVEYVNEVQGLVLRLKIAFPSRQTPDTRTFGGSPSV